MEPVNNTFWGVVLQPGKRYEQVVEKSCHISMAVLDTSNAPGGAQSQVMVTVDGKEFILCHLSKKSPQQALDLNFQGGDSLVLHISGESPQPVHLTGFYNEMDDDDDMDALTMGDSEEEEDNVPSLVSAQLKSLKRKKEQDSPIKQNAKKVKVLPEVEENAEDSDEDDEDDEAEGEEDDEEDDDDEEEEEGFSDDEDDDEDDDDDDDDDEDGEDSDDEESEEEEETKATIPLKKNKQAPNKQIVTNGSAGGDSIKKKPKDDVKPTPKADAKATPAKAEKKMPGKGDKGATPAKTDKGATPAKGAKGATPAKTDKGATPAKADTKTSPTPKKSAKKTIGGGVMVEDLVVGSGAEAKRGRPVSVYYVGRLKQNNKQFDATVGGPGFKFKLGGKEVIKGWDVGVEGMKVGGKRRITCPPHMAYGARGSPPVIPPNSALVFDVTLKNVH